MKSRTESVQWVLDAAPGAALLLFRDAITRIGGSVEAEGEQTLRMKTPRSFRWNWNSATWEIEVRPSNEDGETAATLTLSMPGAVKKSILDHVAREVGDSVVSRTDPPTIREQVKKQTEPKRAELEAELETKLAARQAQHKKRLEEIDARSQELKDRRLKLMEEKPARYENHAVLHGKGVTISFDGEREIEIMRGFRREKREVTASTNAVVDSVGGLSSRPTLTRAATGVLVGGGVGGLLGATAWKRTGDLFLLLEDENWAELVELKPKKVAEARKFAHKITQAARSSRPCRPGCHAGHRTTRNDR